MNELNNIAVYCIVCGKVLRLENTKFTLISILKENRREDSYRTIVCDEHHEKYDGAFMTLESFKLISVYSFFSGKKREEQTMEEQMLDGSKFLDLFS